MSYSEGSIITALKQVIHPEKGKDIVSLNMVEDLVKNMWIRMLK